MDIQVVKIWDALEEQVKFLRYTEREFPFIIKVTPRGVGVWNAATEDLTTLDTNPPIKQKV